MDLEDIIRKVIVDIGYDSSEVGFDGHTCAVVNIIGKQSPDIDQGVDRDRPEEQGAGDQGLMFGYATNETDVLMPAPIYYAHELVKRQAWCGRTTDDGRFHLRPDAKSQVTFRYEDGKPVRYRCGRAVNPAQPGVHRRPRSARTGDGRNHQARAACRMAG